MIIKGCCLMAVVSFCHSRDCGGPMSYKFRPEQKMIRCCVVQLDVSKEAKERARVAYLLRLGCCHVLCEPAMAQPYLLAWADAKPLVFPRVASLAHDFELRASFIQPSSSCTPFYRHHACVCLHLYRPLLPSRIVQSAKRVLPSELMFIRFHVLRPSDRA